MESPLPSPPLSDFEIETPFPPFMLKNLHPYPF